jgi:hypothetical protein
LYKKDINEQIVCDPRVAKTGLLSLPNLQTETHRISAITQEGGIKENDPLVATLDILIS